MPLTNFSKINLKEWICPTLLLLLCIIIVSTIVTKIKQNKVEKIIEGLRNQPTVSTKNISIEKIKLLLPSLKTYLLSKYPTRESLTSDYDGLISNKWEDLSGNNNDFLWNKTPKLIKDKGFVTKNFKLEGPLNSFIELEKKGEMTIVLRTTITNKKEIDSEVTEPVNIGEVIANANLSNGGDTNLMSLNIPSDIKEDFNNLKELLSSKNQNQEILKDILVNSSQIKNILNKHPNKAKKIPRSSPTIILYGKDNKALEIKIPDGNNNLEVDVNGVPTKNIHKMTTLDDAYYTIIYKTIEKGGRLTAYVNTTKVIDEDTGEIILDNNRKVIFNPNENIDIGLKELAILNRELDHKEIGYFLRSDIVLRSIIDNKHLDNKHLDNKHQDNKHLDNKHQDNKHPDNKHPDNKHPDNKHSDRRHSNKKHPDNKHSDRRHSNKKHPDRRHSDKHEKYVYDKYQTDDTYVNLEGETCEEDCTVKCTKNKCIKECANRHKRACPKVHRDSDGNYIVRGSSYGNDRRVAREIYRINYPNCRNIPKILDDWYNKEIILDNTCPFIVDSQFNPCKFYACDNVNWNEPTPKKAGMNQRCRRRTDAYCEEHAYLDPFCYCWRSENYDLPECVEFRSKFNNPRDRGCSAADFPIEENPDFDKYIRKDRIPCWGCGDLN
jgi:hypothetical protein